MRAQGCNGFAFFDVVWSANYQRPTCSTRRPTCNGWYGVIIFREGQEK